MVSSFRFLVSSFFSTFFRIFFLSFILYFLLNCNDEGNIHEIFFQTFSNRRGDGERWKQFWRYTLEDFFFWTDEEEKKQGGKKSNFNLITFLFFYLKMMHLDWWRRKEESVVFRFGKKAFFLLNFAFLCSLVQLIHWVGSKQQMLASLCFLWQVLGLTSFFMYIFLLCYMSGFSCCIIL